MSFLNTLLYGRVRDNMDNAKEFILAKDLFDSLCQGSKGQSKEARRIIKSAHSKQEILNICINTFEKFDTPQSRYLLVMACESSNVSMRKKLINAILNYLSHPIYDYAYKNVKHLPLHGIPTTLEREKDIHLADVYQYLGKAYEGEYQFENAYNAYWKASQLVPERANYIACCSKVLVKMGNFDKALSLLSRYKQSKWYKPVTYKIHEVTRTDSSNKKIIDSEISSVKKLKEKGYVYRPRKLTKKP